MLDLGSETRRGTPELGVEGLRMMRDGRCVVDVPVLTLRGVGPTVILGPNGAGKSLLLRALHGLSAPDAGQVFQDGRPLGEAARATQGMVFQSPVMLRRSVAANLGFVLRRKGLNRLARRERIAELLELADLTGRERQWARSLSGGETQRLAIVRAIANDPRILFLDEPTSALDPAATQRIETLIHTVHQSGVRVIMVTHDVGQARRVGHDIVLMQGGQLAEHTLAADFFTAPQSAAGKKFLSGALVL